MHELMNSMLFSYNCSPFRSQEEDQDMASVLGSIHLFDSVNI